MSPQGLFAHPVLLTLPPPFIRSEPDAVGCNTRIGIGEVALTTAQIAEAPLPCFVVPSIAPNHVGLFLVTLTRIRAEAATLVGGKLGRLLRFTAEGAGKSTYTFVPSVPELAED